MSLIGNLFKPVDQTRSSISASSSSVPFIITSGQALPNHLIGASEALRNSDLYAVTSLISADIAGAKFKGDQVTANLLNHPSKDVSRYTFWQTFILNLLLTGNAFAVIKRDPSGQAIELIPVKSSEVVIDQNDVTGVITYQVNATNVNVSGVYQQSDVIHARIMPYGDNYLQSLLGHSPLESLTNELQRQTSANKLSLSLMTNALAPTGLLKLPEAGQMSEETKESVREKFEKANSGENIGRTIILDETASFSTIEVNADVAKYLTQLDWGRTQIAKAFGIPDSYLNGNGDAQSSLAMISELYINGLNKYIEPITSEINFKMGSTVKLDMQGIIDYSGQKSVNNMINLVDKGIVAPQEAHDKLASRGLI